MRYAAWWGGRVGGAVVTQDLVSATDQSLGAVDSASVAEE